MFGRGGLYPYTHKHIVHELSQGGGGGGLKGGRMSPLSSPLHLLQYTQPRIVMIVPLKTHFKRDPKDQVMVLLLHSFLDSQSTACECKIGTNGDNRNVQYTCSCNV